MRISEKEFSKLPARLQSMLVKLPNPGRDEVLACFPETGQASANKGKQSDIRGNNYGRANGKTLDDSDPMRGYTDSGSAARFFASFPQDEQRLFYCAKAAADDRLGSKHPTIKPLKLLQYLCRLITPKGGAILDCFAGTGATAEAAYREGFNAILIEREVEYLADIAKRMSLITASKAERKQASSKVRSKTGDAGPLFDSAVAKLFEPETLAGLAQLAIDTNSDIKVKIIK